MRGKHGDKSHANEKEDVMSDEDMEAELERPRRENAALKKGASDSVRMKVSEKGCRISLRNGTLSGDVIQSAMVEASA